MNDFDFLEEGAVYLDAACQSLRPRAVINAINDYYTEHNSCGERVKYKWGKITDDKVDATREKVLKYLKLKPRDYVVSFTLNTTYGINLILDQIDPTLFKQVITSDIEHNSPFLSTITFAKKYQLPRVVLERNADGSIPLDQDFTKALVVVNCASNIDGRKLTNIKDLVKTVHKNNGIVIIDAAQAMAHSSDVLHKIEADAICFSAHKMYAPSLGGIIFRKDLLPKLKTTFIGGGMVDDVNIDSYQLSADSPNHQYTKFEAGLQAWGEIVGLGAAIDWLDKLPKSAHRNLEKHSQEIFDFLNNQPRVELVNQEANPTMSFYIKDLDSHLVGEALSRENIMTRTGYFCVHYYLDHKKHLPPLIRFSLGHHIRPEDVNKTITILERLLG